MTPRFLARKDRTSLPRPYARKPRFFRLGIEPLEDRLAPSAGLPPDLIVGRTQSAYSTVDVANNSLSVTYTVYNQRADDITGVLLTTSLQPGVTFTGATQPTDRDGSTLAWGLGTISGYGRASVTVTMAIPAGAAITLDSGARAFGTLDGGAVSADTPAAALTDRALPATFLASTPDANTADPFVQEQAARLRYDPQAFFDYLNDDIGYESYTGSLRGARGTLWSEAGNSLDEASLGVALFRASGIPARYARGPLSTPLASQLVLSMFPPSYQLVGYIPDGTAVADPANNPQLLAETRDHFWLQYDPGTGFTNADSSGLPGGGIGTAFTVATETFGEVVDSLRHKVRVSLDAEIYNSATALFGFAGDGRSTTTVLDRTYNSVDLVGKPLTVGHFVNQSSVGALVFTSRTTTFTPYVLIAGDSANPANDTIETGTTYQELQTNFPFGSQILTGLFLNVTTSGPGLTAEHFMRPLADRIGTAARLGLGSPSVTLSPDGPPLVTDLDTWTIDIKSGRIPQTSLDAMRSELETIQSDLTNLANRFDLTPEGPGRDELVVQSSHALKESLIASARARLKLFDVNSDVVTQNMASSLRVKSYLDRPGVVIFTYRASANGSNQFVITASLDLRKTFERTVVAPQNSPAAGVGFVFVRSMANSLLEGEVFADAPATALTLRASTPIVFEAGRAQNIPLVTITPGTRSLLEPIAISADAKALIGNALDRGLYVVTPTSMVMFEDRPTVSWYEINTTTGEFIGVGEDGQHQGLVQFVAYQLISPYSGTNQFLEGLFAGAAVNGFLNVVLFLVKLADNIYIDQQGNDATNVLSNLKNFLAILRSAVLGDFETILFRAPPAFAAGFGVGVLAGIFFTFDPPLPEIRLDPNPRLIPRVNASANRPIAVGNSLVAGHVSSTGNLSATQVRGNVSVQWTSTDVDDFSVAHFTANQSTLRDNDGNVMGNGTVVLNRTSTTPLSISGTRQNALVGRGTFATYANAVSGLGFSGEWDQYTNAVSGDVILAVTVAAGELSLNGTLLPAGTYALATRSATLTGRGRTASPTFTDSATVTVDDGTVNLGPGTGTLRLGGATLDHGAAITLTRYTGTLNLAAGGPGNNPDAVVLDGNAGNVLQLTAPDGLRADPNNPVPFLVNVRTTLDDTFALFAEAPAGWSVEIDADGSILATPAGGTAAGSYPIRILAKSTTDANLIAQTTVSIAVTETLPGVAFEVTPDPLFTVPYSGAQVPTAFRGAFRNLGPSTDSFNLSFANLPSGFTLRNSGTRLDVPAGQTGILGLYLWPDSGTVLPAPGTVLSFDVTVASVTNPSVSQTRTVTFTMPEVHAVVVVAAPSAVSSTPGASVPVTLTVTAVGNVPEMVALSVTSPAGLSVTGLPPTVALTPGQSVTIPVTFAPSASVPLNTTLSATVSATFGSATTVQTQTLTVPVRVAVPGADAIAAAATAAAQIGNTNLANRLSDLSIALTTLVQSPTSDVARSTSLAAMDAVIGLVEADAYLSPLVASLTNDRAALGVATTAPSVQAAVSSLGATLEDVGQTLTDAVAHRFTLAFVNNTGVAQPLVPNEFTILLRNTGTQTTTYDLTALGVPAGVTVSFSHTSVTLAPGQSTLSAGVPPLTVTLTPGSTELTPFAFEVRAVARTAPAIAQSISGSLSVRSEVVTVVSVSPTPAFADPGVPVAVSARLLNAVNREQVATVQYTVRNAGGTAVFTSAPVSANLTVLTSLSTVALGTLNTTGFALGNYTITVTVTDDTGNPIPGATGTGHLLVGSPVTASLSIDPTALPPGTGTVTSTLVIDAQGASVGPLGVVSLTELPGAGGVVRHGHYVFASGTAGIGVYDVADPANPQLIRTFGSHANTLEIRGDKLYALAFGGPFGRFPLTIYSLTDPENPQLLGAATFNGQDGIPYSLAWNMVVTETHVFVSVWSTTHLIGGQNDIRFQTGDVLAFDVSDPTAPVFVSALLNTYGTNNDGIGQFLNVDVSGGDGNLWEIVQVDANTLLVAGSTARGDDTQTGNGVVHVIDISNPAQMTIVRTLVIPGTVQAVGLSIEGNRAFVAGSQGGWNDPAPTGRGDFTGNLVLATLDISAPRNPVLIDSEILNRSSWGPYSLRTAPLGNGRYALSSQGNPQDQPVLFVVDANDPANLVTSQTTIPTATANLDGVGNFIYATSPSGLIIYQLDAADAISTTARVTVPTADGVAVVPGSFSLAPTRTLTVAGGTTYEWDLSLSGATTTITWQSTVADVQPGRSRTVASNGSVSFVSQGTAGEVEVADQFVAGVQILGLTPASQTAAPGDAVTFGVVLENPTGASVTYSLGVTGVPGGWVDLAASAIVPANGSVTVPLTLTTDAFAALAAYGLTITATAGSVTSSVRGTLTLAGTPMLPDPQSHGVVVSLTPTNAIAGPGTTAVFIVRVTNTGSATETYDLTTSLPARVAGILSQTSVTVPPGVGNFREVTLRLTPAAGTTPGDFNVSVNAIAGAVSDFAEALLTVVNRSVTVSLDRTFLAPGETATATVTNTGSVADSFDLSLTGPAGLVSTLGVTRIDLAPGESRTVTVTTNSTVPFAVAGAMPLSVVSQSLGNPAVRGAASTNVMVPQSVGLTAAFRQSSRVIAAPGTADFTLDVSNLGTGEDAYEAMIIGSTGRVTAVLIGLNGQPASSMPTFRLPGLSQGVITVRANLADIGSGTVTIRIRSLSDPTRESVRIATLGTTSPTRPTPLVVGGATNGTAVVYSPTFGQFGPGTPLTFFPGFAGDVRTATADVTGDGIDDFIGGSGPGLAEVAIMDGATLQVIARFNPFESSFTLGVYVAAADLNGDGKADVVVTPDLGGGPVVAVYDGSKLAAGLANGQGFGQPAQIVRYYGIEGDPNFRGGARPSLGDVDGDGTPDLMVSAGFLGGPRIALFNGVDVAAGDDTPRHLIPDFYAFEPTLRNGAFVALGDITGDGRAELVFGGGPTGGNRVRVFDAAAVLAAPGFESLDQLPAAAQLNNFFTGDPSLRGGARVAVKYIDDSGKAALITGSGNDERARVQVYSSTLLLASPTPAAPDQVIEPFDLILANGAFVG